MKYFKHVFFINVTKIYVYLLFPFMVTFCIFRINHVPEANRHNVFLKVYYSYKKAICLTNHKRNPNELFWK